MARPGRPAAGLLSLRLKLELLEAALDLFALRLSERPSLLLAAVLRLTLEVLGLASLRPSLCLEARLEAGLSSLLLPVFRAVTLVSEDADLSLEAGLESLMLGTLRTVTRLAEGLASRFVSRFTSRRVKELDLVTSRWELDRVTIFAVEFVLSSFDFVAEEMFEFDSCLVIID